MILNNWLSLIQSVLFLAGGLCFIRFRVAISSFYARSFRALNTPLGEREVRASRPRTMLAVGVIMLCIAAGALAMGLFRRQW